MNSRSYLATAAALATLAALAAGPAHAQDAPLEEVLKEVRQLRSEVLALKLMLSQLAELDRQRAAVIARALEGTTVPPARTPEPPPERRKAPALAPPTVVAPPLAAAPETPPVREVRTPAARAPSNGSASGILTGRVEVPSGEPVAYVYVENVRAAPVRGETVTMEQLRKQFAPRWAVVRRGTTIAFPNLDNVYHNVFSRSAGNSFDLGLYNASDGAKSHTFVTSGPVDIYCNIHPQMSARVLVVPNQYFAKVRPDGTFSIPDVPTGKRKVVAWSPGSEEVATWVELDRDGSAEVSLKLASRGEGHLNKAGRPYGSYP